MLTKATKRPYKKIALIMSLFFLLIWAILGTGASLAWFTDTSEEVTNIFHFADFELAVSHRLENGTWEPIDGKTDIFDKEALYEPGYVQVVYLKVENLGEVPFHFHTAVSVSDFTPGVNVYGNTFHLQDYLKFGIAIANTEAEMENAVKTRDQAKKIATSDLCDYAPTPATLPSKGVSYLALVLYLPEEVHNVANYRENKMPTVELGIIVKAEQLKK